MIGVLGHDSALLWLYWAGDNLANEMNFGVNHALGAGSIALPTDQQSSALPLYHGCLPTAWTHEMNFGVNHAPGAALIALPTDQQATTALGMLAIITCVHTTTTSLLR